MKRILMLIIAIAVAAQLQAKPLKVFVLGGQSNMEGHEELLKLSEPK